MYASAGRSYASANLRLSDDKVKCILPTSVKRAVGKKKNSKSRLPKDLGKKVTCGWMRFKHHINKLSVLRQLGSL